MSYDEAMLRYGERAQCHPLSTPWNATRYDGTARTLVTVSLRRSMYLVPMGRGSSLAALVDKHLCRNGMDAAVCRQNDGNTDAAKVDKAVADAAACRV